MPSGTPHSERIEDVALGRLKARRKKKDQREAPACRSAVSSRREARQAQSVQDWQGRGSGREARGGPWLQRRRGYSGYSVGGYTVGGYSGYTQL
jgi:hypothetical protein